MRDFTIRSNTNGLGLRSNAIKDLCPLILHQLVTGWIGKAHGLKNSIKPKHNELTILQIIKDESYGSICH